MSVTVKITDDGLGFIMKGEGVVTGREIIDGVYERFSSEEKIKNYIYGISDYTEVESVKMTADEVRVVAEKDKDVSKINPDIVIAIAAPKDVIYGLSRMFSVYANDTGWEINVFRTVEETRKSILENLRIKGHDVRRITFSSS